MKRQWKIFRMAGLLSLVLALMVVGVVFAATVVVDEFVSGTGHSITIIVPDDGEENPDLPQTSTSLRDNAAILGAERDLQLTVNSGNINDTAQWRVQTTSGTNYLSLDEAPNIEVVAVAQWDGNDSSLNLDCTTGLEGVDEDFTGGGTNDGILIRFVFTNSHPNMTLRLYTDCSNWEEATIETPRDVSSGQIVDVFIPFNSFGGGVGTLDPQNVNALELELDTTAHPGSDVQFKFIRATGVKEYGDLPDTGTNAFGASIVDAYHISQGLRLGTNVDAEASDNPSTSAAGDDGQGTPDDEDGVVRDANDFWQLGASVDLLFTVNGCPNANCYLNGWIDWNQDGDFADTGERVIADDNQIGNNSNQTRTITVVSAGNNYDVGDPIYARFRICPDANSCDDPDDTSVTNGEIEDYYWDFGPTALSLTSVKATSGAPVLVGVLAAVMLVAAGGVVVFRRRRA